VAGMHHWGAPPRTFPAAQNNHPGVVVICTQVYRPPGPCLSGREGGRGANVPAFFGALSFCASRSPTTEVGILRTRRACPSG
jgi:hypothetical protein